MSGEGGATPTFSWKPAEAVVVELAQLSWPERLTLANLVLKLGRELDPLVSTGHPQDPGWRYYSDVAHILGGDELPAWFMDPGVRGDDHKAKRFEMYQACAAYLKGRHSIVYILH